MFVKVWTYDALISCPFGSFYPDKSQNDSDVQLRMVLCEHSSLSILPTSALLSTKRSNKNACLLTAPLRLTAVQINGMATNTEGALNNGNVLSTMFGRPVQTIHNKSAG